MPDAVNTVVCAPDDGWRYRPKHAEAFPEINKLCNVASCRHISEKQLFCLTGFTVIIILFRSILHWTMDFVSSRDVSNQGEGNR